MGGGNPHTLPEERGQPGCGYGVAAASPLPSCLQLLLKPKFSGVEKIKTIGSTYMAAAGLSVASGHENQVLKPKRGNSADCPHLKVTCHLT